MYIFIHIYILYMDIIYTNMCFYVCMSRLCVSIYIYIYIIRICTHVHKCQYILYDYMCTRYIIRVYTYISICLYTHQIISMVWLLQYFLVCFPIPPATWGVPASLAREVGGWFGSIHQHGESQGGRNGGRDFLYKVHQHTSARKGWETSKMPRKSKNCISACRPQMPKEGYWTYLNMLVMSYLDLPEKCFSHKKACAVLWISRMTRNWLKR